MLLAAGTVPPRDGLHTSYSGSFRNARTRREHVEPLNAGFHLGNGGGEGGGSSQRIATAATTAAAAAVIRGEPSERRKLRETGRPSMRSNADTSVATADLDHGHHRLPHSKSDCRNDRERHELDDGTDTKRDMRATTEQSPDVTVDIQDEEGLHSPETLTSNTLVPSFCSAEAFERYASLHEAITTGKSTPRSARGGEVVIRWRLRKVHESSQVSVFYGLLTLA